MKILCPTDFSSAANNSIEYAAKLAQKTNATLTLLNVQKLYLHEGVSLFSGGELESVQEARTASKSLEEICIDINKSFNVSCNHEIIPSMSSYESVISREAEKYNLTVIGTNGADNTFEFYFGSNSFRVAKNTNSPVLIVPDGCSFKEISNVVFASDYNKGDELVLNQLKEFTKFFSTQINIIHISKADSDLGKQVYRSFCNLIEESFNLENNIHFKRIFSDDPAEAIERFTNETNSDLLAIYFHPHNILYRMFHENLIKKITSRAEFPMLIFHE